MRSFSSNIVKDPVALYILDKKNGSILFFKGEHYCNGYSDNVDYCPNGSYPRCAKVSHYEGEIINYTLWLKKEDYDKACDIFEKWIEDKEETYGRLASQWSDLHGMFNHRKELFVDE